MGRYNSGYMSTGESVSRIRLMYRNGMIPCKERVLKRGERLDKIAGQEYGDSNLWWVIAAVSFIGFPSQVPVGTIIRVPENISQLLTSIGIGGSYG